MSEAKRIIEEMKADLFRGERAAIAFAREVVGANPNIEIDGREFGLHVTQGGWRLGLLAARSCQAWGFRSGRSKAADFDSNAKVSVNAFAGLSGVSAYLITQHLAAWDLAAAAGVPDIIPASELQPGDEIPFNVQDHDPAIWKRYFKLAARPRPVNKNLLKACNRRSNTVANIEAGKYRDRTLFEHRSDYSLKEVFDANERWVRAVIQKGLQIRENLIAVAEEMGYTMSFEDETEVT